MSDQPIDKIAEALSKAQGEIKAPIKNRKVDFTNKLGQRIKYNYADLADVIESMKGPLSKNGLAACHRLVREVDQYVMITELLHSSGQRLETWYPLPDPVTIRPQEFGSALTYARRYSISALIGIASEEDDDGAEAAQPLKARPQSDNEPRAFREAKEQREKAEIEAKRILGDQSTGGVGGNQVPATKIAEAMAAKTVKNYATGENKSLPPFDPGDYVITFGKEWGAMGKKIKDVNESVHKVLLMKIETFEKQGHGKPVYVAYRKHAMDFLASVGVTIDKFATKDMYAPPSEN